MESASAHSVSLKLESINKVQDANPKKSEVRDCRLCPVQHVMTRRENCPAFGKSCKKCRKKNHHHTKCYQKSDDKAHEDAASPKKYKKKGGKKAHEPH